MRWIIDIPRGNAVKAALTSDLTAGIRGIRVPGRMWGITGGSPHCATPSRGNNGPVGRTKEGFGEVIIGTTRLGNKGRRHGQEVWIEGSKWTKEGGYRVTRGARQAELAGPGASEAPDGRRERLG